MNAQSSTNDHNTSSRVRALYQLNYKIDSAATMPTRVTMILRYSDGISRFQSYGLHMMDSVYLSLKNTPEQERLQQAMNATWKGGKNEFQYTILKKSAENLVSYHDFINSERYQYQEKAPLFSWRVTPQRKAIAGYNCQQAFTMFGGRVWEAWFTRDVPVSDGPYKFYGLPGLILQVRDTRDHYVFSLLCLDTNPAPFDAATDTGAPLSAKLSAGVVEKRKFLQAKLNDDLTFTDRMAASGNHVPEEMRKSYLEKLKRRNNPLERE